MNLGLVLELAIVLCGVTVPAQAETKRMRIPVDALPRQDLPTQVSARDAVLPDGAREGAAMPTTWKLATRETPHEAGHCTDGRRASVKTIIGDDTFTAKIWESNGKVFVDRAHVEIDDGKVHVVSAERFPLVSVGEGIWAHRSAREAVIVFARDVGKEGRSTFFECLVDSQAIAISGGVASFESSPDNATGVRDDMYEVANIRRKPGPWVGIAFRLLASVSKASADPEAMLNLVMTKP